MVLTGSHDSTAQLWDVTIGKPLGPPFRHESWVRRVTFSQDGQTIATGSEDGVVRMWKTPAAAVGPKMAIRLELEVATGLELDEFDAVRGLDAMTWEDRRSQLETVSGH